MSPLETELSQVEAVHERVHHAYQRIGRDVVLDTWRKKTDLGAVRTFDEAHWILSRTPQNSLILWVFGPAQKCSLPATQLIRPHAAP